LLGLLVSKFKRGGVNRSYKFFANTNWFTVILKKKNNLILKRTYLLFSTLYQN